MAEARGYERLSPRPIPDEIIARMKSLRDPVTASGQVAWIYITSGAGLTLRSNPNKTPTFSSQSGRSIHGGITFNNGQINGISANAGEKEEYFENIPLGGGTYPFRPRPVVESVEVKTGKHGLSKKATIKVKCFTIEQLELVASHFMEPAFTIVVQWGWTDGARSAITGAKKGNLKGPDKFANINNFPKNQKRKIDARCAYENFFGVITGGSISIDGESFELNIEATGMGELALNLQTMTEVTCEEEPEKTPPNGIWTDFIDSAYKKAKAVVNWTVSTFTAITNFHDVTKKTDWNKEPFLNMYGALPPELQTTQIKELGQKDVKRIKTGGGFTYTAPLIWYTELVGFNEGVLKKLQERSKWGQLKNWFSGGPQGPTISGVNIQNEALIDGERFIRFDALMLILETVPLDLKRGLALAGDKDNLVSLKINTENVPITAFKYIFSTDKTKLLILNKTMPDFGLLENFQNPDRNPASVYVFYGKGTPSSGGSMATPTYPTVDTAYTGMGYADVFPAHIDLNTGNTTQGGISAEKFKWGYLDKLYINFDYAMEIIKKPSMTAKDVLLEMLNGMSSAVNNLWDFQITESEDEHGNVTLSIADMNFVSFQDVQKFPYFTSTGVNSIFKSLSYGVDIPGAMKNQIIAKRAGVENQPKKTPKLNSRLPEIHPTLWGTNYKDQLYKFIESRVNNPCDPAPAPPSTTPTGDAIQRNALEFIKKAGVYVKYRDPSNVKSTEDAFMEQLVVKEIMYVGAFADTSIFDSLRNAVGILEGRKGGILLPVTVTFTVMGVGGFEFGHSFKLADAIKKFRDTGIFQITEITHNVNGNTWETTVEAKFRPL